MADESLLDVFVRILPDPDFEAAVDGVADRAIARIREKFGSAAAPVMKPPVISTGGTGGSFGRGGGQGAQLADQYREAKRAVEDLLEQSRRLKIEFASISSIELDEGIKLASTEIRRLQVDIQRQSQDKDPIGIQSSIDLIPDLERRLQELRTTGAQKLNIQQQFQNIVAGERGGRADFAIERRLAGATQRGVPSGTTRVEMAKLTAEIQRSQLEFDQLVRSFDGSPIHLQRLQEAVQRINVGLDGASGRSGFKALDQQAQAAQRSVNGLGNNAYQLGQAFEDAAVGFSLNGVAGAVRGASNNISFLINNLVQAKAASGQLTGAFARQIPLIAGVGAAVALVVVGPLVEWLESLNDIETKVKDISEELRRTFEDIRFEVNIGIKENDLRRTLAEAGTLEDIIGIVKRLNVEAENGKEQIRGLFAGFEDSGNLKKVREDLRGTIGAVTDELDKIEQIRKRLADAAGVEVDELQKSLTSPSFNIFADISDERLATVRKFSDAIGEASQSVELVRLNAREGIVNTPQLETAVKLLNDLESQVVDFAKGADLASETFGEDFKSNVSAVRDELTRLRDISREVTSALQVQFNDALDAGDRKIGEIRERLDLVRSTIEGVGREQSLFLFDLQNTTDEFERQIKSSSELTDLQKKRAIAQSQQNNVLVLAEREIGLRENLKKIEQRIADIREKDRRSQFLSLESFTQKLQMNALGDDPQKKQLDELNRERERQLAALAQNRVADSRVQRGDQFGNLDIQFRNGRFGIPDPNERGIDPLERMLEQTLIQGFFEMTKEQKNTTKAIKEAELDARAG